MNNGSSVVQVTDLILRAWDDDFDGTLSSPPLTKGFFVLSVELPGLLNCRVRHLSATIFQGEIENDFWWEDD